KADETVNAKVVSDTLAALRGLKLERYVKDSDAQLSLYGLEAKKEELTLTVTTPDGTKTLLVGGRAGPTNQRYARLPGANKDVFMLDETASTKLFRDLKAFTKKEGPP